jgi:hypothetical protein
MRRLIKPGITAFVLFGLLVGSGVAWAQEEASEPEDAETAQDADTLFSFGYDILHRFFGWNLSALDGLFDCSLEGTYTATYGAPTDDGVIPVDDLQDEAGVVIFPERPEEELAEGLEPVGAPFPYSGADSECGVSGADVTGPAGQVNHGMFMKLFNSLYDGTGRGCVVRHLAQSDLGKGDQQVAPDEDPDFEPVVGGESGQIDFASVETDCEHGKKSENQADIDAQTTGRPDHAGKPEGTGKPENTGKPDDAGKPGHAGKPDNPGRSAPGNDD